MMVKLQCKTNRIILTTILSFVIVFISMFAILNLEYQKNETRPSVNTLWYEQYKIIAHSGGAIDGNIYTDAREAFEYSYSRGDRVFDADLNITSDGRVVLRHEWSDTLETGYDNRVPTYQEFMNGYIFGRYTPMDLGNLIDFMHSHADAYVAVDAKINIEYIYSEIIRLASEADKRILDRIIISFYNYEDYDTIKNIYAFNNFTIRQYENHPHNYKELLKFCLQHNIPTISIKSKYIDNPEITLLKEHGLKLYVAVVDSEDQFKSYIHNGINGIISNSIYEDQT